MTKQQRFWLWVVILSFTAINIGVVSNSLGLALIGIAASSLAGYLFVESPDG